MSPYSSPADRAESKSPQHSLAARLECEAGLHPAQIRVTLELLADHLQQYYSDVRPPGVIIQPAVSAKEPAGKPIKHCTLVPVKLTWLDPADIDLQLRQGPVEVRLWRIYRFCWEARRQGALLSYEDLHFLLCVDLSTIKDLVRELRARGLEVPTRGHIKDIGPEPSHKRRIAHLLGLGLSTTQIRAATGHAEGSIARYQQQFGLVIYLLATYPQASDDERALLSGLSRAAYDVYCEVYRDLADRPQCQPHLERLRRRYEMDPEGLAQQRPLGKAAAQDPTARLRQHTLDTVVRQTIQDDLGTTRRVAEAVAQDVMEVIDRSLQLPEEARPGETMVFVDAHDPGLVSGERQPDRRVMPVRVPLYTEDIKQVWRQEEEPIGRRRARVAAMIATAAQEQGGVMNMVGLAELVHVTPQTLSKELRELAVALHVEAPTKGLIEDSGPTLTHKNWIVDLDQHGLTGEEISWLTRHAPHSRDRYIETYRRAEALMRLAGGIPTTEHLARVLSLRPHVAKQYVDLLARYHDEGKATEAIAAPALAVVS